MQNSECLAFFCDSTDRFVSHVNKIQCVYRKVKVGKAMVRKWRKAQSERNSHSKNLGGKKKKIQSGTNTKKTYHKPNELLFPYRWPLSYTNLAKNIKTYIRHKTIRTVTEVSPWYDQ